MLFLTSCLSFSLSSCKRRNGRARAHAIRTCRYSNMFEKQNSLYRLKKGAECEILAMVRVEFDPREETTVPTFDLAEDRSLIPADPVTLRFFPPFLGSA